MEATHNAKVSDLGNVARILGKLYEDVRFGDAKLLEQVNSGGRLTHMCKRVARVLVDKVSFQVRKESRKFPQHLVHNIVHVIYNERELEDARGRFVCCATKLHVSNLDTVLSALFPMHNLTQDVVEHGKVFAAEWIRKCNLNGDHFATTMRGVICTFGWKTVKSDLLRRTDECDWKDLRELIFLAILLNRSKQREAAQLARKALHILVHGFIGAPPNRPLHFRETRLSAPDVTNADLQRLEDRFEQLYDDLDFGRITGCLSLSAKMLGTICTFGECANEVSALESVVTKFHWRSLPWIITGVMENYGSHMDSLLQVLISEWHAHSGFKQDEPNGFPGPYRLSKSVWASLLNSSQADIPQGCFAEHAQKTNGLELLECLLHSGFEKFAGNKHLRSLATSFTRRAAVPFPCIDRETERRIAKVKIFLCENEREVRVLKRRRLTL